MNYLEKIKKAGLVGRGGAAFPTHIKWASAQKAEGSPKYVICNSSEGEMGLFKDLHVWRNYPERVFQGMVYAMEFIGSTDAYIYINRNYHFELRHVLHKFMNDHKWTKYKFHIYIEKPSYVGGEASTVLNAIENGKHEPKPRIHRTTEKGLFKKPTLMQNVETFYDIANAIEDKYDFKRFSGIIGDGVKEGFIVRHPNEATLKEILEQAKVKPDFDFYVQVGGGASGLVYNKDQLDKQIMSGAGSLEIFDKSKKSSLVFLQRLFKFYSEESCGKCTPCREGTFQLYKMVKDLKDPKDVPWDEVLKITELMVKSAFCKLGKGITGPVESYIENVRNRE